MNGSAVAGDRDAAFEPILPNHVSHAVRIIPSKAMSRMSNVKQTMHFTIKIA